MPKMNVRMISAGTAAKDHFTMNKTMEPNGILISTIDTREGMAGWYCVATGAVYTGALIIHLSGKMHVNIAT